MTYHDVFYQTGKNPQGQGVDLRDRAIAADVMELVRNRPHSTSPGQQTLPFDCKQSLISEHVSSAVATTPDNQPVYCAPDRHFVGMPSLPTSAGARSSSTSGYQAPAHNQPDTTNQMTPQVLFSHKLGQYVETLRASGVVWATDLNQCAHGSMVTVAGVRSVVHTPGTSTGNRVVFISLDDPTGLVDLAFFPSVPGHYLAHAMSEPLVVARGVLSHTAPRGHNITGRAAWPLRTWLERHS